MTVETKDFPLVSLTGRQHGDASQHSAAGNPQRHKGLEGHHFAYHIYHHPNSSLGHYLQKHIMHLANTS